MISRKLLTVIGGFVLGAAALVPAAKAGESDQLTKMTFSQPVEVAGRTLPAGTYWFKIWDQQNDTEKNLINIYTADFSHLVMVAPTRPVQRRDTGYGTAVPVPSMNKTELRLATETNNGQTALVTWFYPYGFDGHQYLQSRKDRRELHDQPVNANLEAKR
jgi:hypothetical protein